MILIDTSVWIDHLRTANTRLIKFLESGDVVVHRFVMGELACGNLRNRNQILELLRVFPCAADADHQDVLFLVQESRLFGKGIGWIDAHLAASALVGGYRFWTLDKTLLSVCRGLGIGTPASG